MQRNYWSLVVQKFGSTGCYLSFPIAFFIFKGRKVKKYQYVTWKEGEES